MLDFANLLEPISEDAPCGANLEYDEQFGAMERAAQAKPEQQFGATVIAGEEPDWREVQQLAESLLKRTKDLRVGVELARAVLNTNGIGPFCECLAVLAQWNDSYWEGLHPQLDPEDANDPTLRGNTLSALASPQASLAALSRAPLASSRSHGRISLRDIAIAKGDMPAPAGMTSPPTTAQVESVFADCDLAELAEQARQVQSGASAARQLMTSFNNHAGSAAYLDWMPLVDQLSKIQAVLDEQLLARGVLSEPAPAAENGAPAATGAPVPDGEIRSREDVVRALDRICQYYARHEPSSPIPLLLRRAKRLTSASFLDILRDLAPAGVAEAETIGGPPEPAEGG